MNTSTTSVILAITAALLTAPGGLHANDAIPTQRDAPIALLVDMSSGQTLHAREADRRFLPASVTKVMTAYVAFEMIAAGKLSINTEFAVSDTVFDEWSGEGSSMFVAQGSKLRVDQLLRGITTVSANDASIILAEGAAGSVEKWVAKMNRTAAMLGMRNSHFGTPNGWPDEGQTFTTARDLAMLTQAMITRHPDLYRTYFGQRSFNFNGRLQDNHDPITGVVPGADGVKTGFTREAGYNLLGSAERGGRRLVMVVAATPSGPERAKLSRAYLEWGFSGFEQRRLFDAGSVLGRARVQDGAQQTVALRASRPILIDIPAGTEPEITLSLRYRGPLKAPIKAHAQVADLDIRIDGFEPFSVPLEAAMDVPQANLFQRIMNSIGGLFA